MPDQQKAFADLVSAVLACSSAKIPAIVNELARQGSLDAIESLYGSAPALSTAWPNDHPLKADLAYGILSLPGNVPAEHRTRAEQLVTTWLEHFEAQSHEQMAKFLDSCTDKTVCEELSRRLTQHGENSEAIATKICNAIWRRNDPQLISALVTGAASKGDLEPYRLALSELCSIATDSYAGKVIECLPTLTEPLGEYGRLGESVTQEVLRHSQGLDTASWIEQFTILGHLMSIMERAGLQSNHWQKIAQSWSDRPHVWSVLVEAPGLLPQTVRMLEAMHNAEVNIASFNAYISGKRDPVPLLHAAVKQNRAAIVHLLLEAGSDPSVKTKYQGKIRTPRDLAPEGSDSRSVFDSYRARTVLAAAARTANKNNGR